MERILSMYYENNAKKLHEIVNKILLKFGGLSDKDMDDFYSLANEVFADVIKRYDRKQSFEGFLYSCLSNRIKTEITRRNRNKRMMDKMSVSIDTPIGEEEDVTLGDMIADGFDMEREVLGEKEDGYSEKTRLYLKRLSKIQKEILKLLSAGYSPHEIQKELHISEKEYSDGNLAIHSYRNISVLL